MGMEKDNKAYNFRHKLPIQIRFNDIDLFGHVNNAVYFNFFDLGKTNYFEVTAQNKVDWKNVGMVVAGMQVEFFSPIFFSEKIEVQTTVSELGNRSFKLVQQIVNSESNEVKCICFTTMVGYDPSTSRSSDISAKWKEAVCLYEGADLNRPQ